MMRKILLLLLTIILVTSCKSQKISIENKVKKVKHFGNNKGKLKMYSYIPKNLDISKPVPLVTILHGCSQSAHKVAKATSWNKLADSLNFIAIYPEQRLFNNVSKCFNWFIPFDAKKNKGELASIKEMIDYTIKTNNIDTTRVFITGMSAGGGMSYALLNAYPRFFNAGALLGTSSILISNTSTDSVQPRIFILQGEKDLIVHKNNGERLIKQWCEKHKIDSNDFVLTDEIDENSLLSTKTFYKKNKVAIVYLLAKNVGHKLLINPGEDIKHGGKNGFHTKNIGFFSTYFIADFFGLVKHKNK